MTAGRSERQWGAPIYLPVSLSVTYPINMTTRHASHPLLQ
jgi:hypothetical protein